MRESVIEALLNYSEEYTPVELYRMSNEELLTSYWRYAYEEGYEACEYELEWEK